MKNNNADSFHIKNFLDANIQTIKDNEAAKRQLLKGLSTGYFFLDRLTKGLQASNLIVLAGYSKSGKTALALNIARNLAVDMDVPTLIFSSNVPGEKLSLRLLEMEAQVRYYVNFRGQLKPSDWEDLKAACQKFSKAPLYLDSCPLISMDHIREKASGLAREYGIKLIIIDYFQMIEGAHSHPEMVARALKQLAMDLAIPVMVLLKREGLREHQEDEIFEVDGCGELSRYGDHLILIRRTTGDDDLEVSSAEIYVAENGTERMGMMKLKYDSWGCFQEY